MAELSRKALARLREMRRKLCKGKNHSWLYIGATRPIGVRCCCGKITWTGEKHANA